MEIQEKNKSVSALPRTEYEFLVKFENNTPSRADLKSKIASKLKSKEEVTVVKKIYTDYGKKEANVTVYVYDKADELEKIEFKHVLKKHNPPKEGEEGEQ